VKDGKQQLFDIVLTIELFCGTVILKTNKKNIAPPPCRFGQIQKA